MARTWIRWLVLWLGLCLASAAWAQTCEHRFVITFADGSKGCLSDYDIVERRPSMLFSSLRRAVPSTGFFALAATPTAPECPSVLVAEVSTSPYQVHPSTGTPETRRDLALSRCQRQVPSDAAAHCSCKLLLTEGASPLSRAEFARFAKAPEAVARASGEAPAAALVERPRPAPAPVPAPPVRPAAPAADTPPPATSSSEVAELRRQLEQLKAQVAQAKPPAAPAPREEAAAVRSRAIALVIGNGAYKHLGALPNPRRDAMDVAAKLRGFGIEVDLLLDADRNALVKALNDHQRKALDRDVNILYYAGHGLQVGGTNYIAPVDMLADGISAGYVKLNGVALVDALEYLPARTRLVFLDACRDNPASRSLVASRSVAAPGLAPMAATSGTLISYATRDGAVAEDGQGRNSPYTAALLEHLGAADDIAVVLRRVRQSVMRTTANRQEPWEYGSLVGDQLVLSRLGR